MLQITVNNQPQKVQANATVTDVLVANHIKETKGVAVALNDLIIPKTLWNRHQVKQGDRMTIITATAGG